MASLKDIAKRCGVSVATVSKALNGHSDISEETKAKIEQAARELGYTPNLSARALKTKRSYEIGVLYEDEAGSGLTHEHFSIVLDNFKKTIEERGYDITFINNNIKQLKSMTYLEHGRYHNFDGVMLSCIDFSEAQVEELINSNIPIVAIDKMVDDTMSIVSDNEQGMYDLVSYIISMGHTRIAYVHGPMLEATKLRLEGFYRALREHGITVPEEYLIEAPYRNIEGTYEATKKLLKIKQRPTCIIYPDDFASVGGMNAIRNEGFRIPEDISVAGYDGIRTMISLEPQLTTLVQDAERIGTIAAKKLIELIEGPKVTGVEQIMIPGKVHQGHTVAKIGN